MSTVYLQGNTVTNDKCEDVECSDTGTYGQHPLSLFSPLFGGLEKISLTWRSHFVFGAFGLFCELLESRNNVAYECLRQPTVTRMFSDQDMNDPGSCLFLGIGVFSVDPVSSRTWFSGGKFSLKLREYAN